MADLAALTGDLSYINSSEHLWNDIVNTKLYITGGVGAAGGHEGFGAKYELPNATAYCETCAAIANVFWNHRRFLMEGDAKYIDILERSLYNNVLSGVSISGDLFFYPNPLESFQGTKRSEWFGCACCPSNICRFIPAVPNYLYAIKDNEIYVNLYMSSEADLKLKGTQVKLTQFGEMPWNGNIEILIEPEKVLDFEIKLRIPGWARGEVVPGSTLYWYQNKISRCPTVRVNGELVELKLEKGYLNIKREWQKGDKITLDLPIEIQRVVCNSKVIGNNNKVALQYGPIMYCSEGVDFVDPQISSLILPESTELSLKRDLNKLADMLIISGKAKPTQRLLNGEIITTEEVDFTAIPYYAWAQRGLTPMVMWYPTKINNSKPKPAPTIANLSKLDGSLMTQNVESIRDQILPINSNDNSCQFFHWWPSSNKTEWITYTFNKPYTISKSKVYWYNDNEGCRPPKSWRLYYKKNGAWIEVNKKNEYGTRLNILNETEFDSITTTAVKLEIDLPEDTSSGIHEWIIE